MLRFEWDARKAQQNHRKHGINFTEARTVFLDDHAMQFEDETDPDGEQRFVLLGMSGLQRVLVVCHCERLAGNMIRIISARKATAKERRYYRDWHP